MTAIDRSEFQQDKLDLFWTFVNERQTIWYKRKKLKLPPPWTEDPILDRNFFTNIYRELDPATKWMRKNILENEGLSDTNKVFNIMMFRLMGSQERTMKAIGLQKIKKYTFKQVDDGLRSIDRPFGKAYNVYPNTKYRDIDKIANVAVLFGEMAVNFADFAKELRAAPSSRAAYEVLSTPWAFGPFLGYQSLLDCLYPIHSRGGAALLPFDRNEFVQAGPGAKRGISSLLGTTKVGNRYDPVMRWLHANQQKEFKRLGLKFHYMKQDGKKVPIWLSDVQNSLCEYSKFVRIYDGGQQKATRLYRKGG